MSRVCTIRTQFRVELLCMAPKKYIEKIVSNYEMMFGEKPKLNMSSPLEKGDHPEVDTSELLDPQGTQQYQSLIGSLQWAVSLGRLDIATTVMLILIQDETWCNTLPDWDPRLFRP